MQNHPADIMRGEETQISGFINKNKGFKGVVCLPGTHAKWVNIQEGQISSFKTFMTGELFGVISNHTLIRHSTSIKGWNQESFEEGIHELSLIHISEPTRPEPISYAVFCLKKKKLLKLLIRSAS